MPCRRGGIASGGHLRAALSSLARSSCEVLAETIVRSEPVSLRVLERREGV